MKTILLILVGLMLLALLWMMISKMMNKQKQKKSFQNFTNNKKNLVPKFKELNSGYVHKLTDTHNMQPLVGISAHDILDNGNQAIFVSGAKGQANGVFVYEDGKVKDIAADLGLEGDLDDAVYCFAIGDVDNDGLDEVLMGQNSGIYLYSRSQKDSKFTKSKLDVTLPEDATPVDMQLADVDKNGNLNLYVSTFIDHKKHSTANYNDPDLRVDNVYYQNDGTGKFVDKTEEAGLKLHQNSFEAKWVDLNGNDYLDLVVSTNTDKISIFKNNGDGTFSKVDTPFGYGFWMGLAVGDIDNDGLPEVFISNIGKTMPAFMVKGDLTKDQPTDLSYKLLKHNGDFKFRDIAVEKGVDNPVFGWGAVFADFTNNGKLDLVSTENFYGFPMNIHKFLPNPGKLYLHGDDGKFVDATSFVGVENYHFGYRALAVDFTGNGYNDLILGNIDGPLRIFSNTGV